MNHSQKKLNISVKFAQTEVVFLKAMLKLTYSGNLLSGIDLCNEIWSLATILMPYSITA